MLRLLLPLDGSACAERTVPHALALARAFSASVKLLRVVPRHRDEARSAASRFDSRLERRKARLYLEPIAEQFRRSGIPAEVAVEEGNPAELIAAAAKASADQLLVMSTHGRGGAFDVPRGSVAAKVLANYRDSMFLLRPQASPASGRHRRIAALVDLSRQSRAVLPSAARLAESQDADLLIACALRSPELPPVLRRNPRAARLHAELSALQEEAARAALAELRRSLPGNLRVETEVILFSDLQSAVARIGLHHDIDLLVLSDDWPDAANGRRTETTPMLIVGPHGLQVERIATPATIEPPETDRTLTPATLRATEQAPARTYRPH